MEWFFLMSVFAERTEFQSLYKKRETYQTIGIFLSMIRRTTVRRIGEDAKIQTNNKGCQEAKFPHLHFAMFASLAFTSFTISSTSRASEFAVQHKSFAKIDARAEQGCSREKDPTTFRRSSTTLETILAGFAVRLLAAAVAARLHRRL